MEVLFSVRFKYYLDATHLYALLCERIILWETFACSFWKIPCREFFFFPGSRPPPTLGDASYWWSMWQPLQLLVQGQMAPYQWHKFVDSVGRPSVEYYLKMNLALCSFRFCLFKVSRGTYAHLFWRFSHHILIMPNGTCDTTFSIYREELYCVTF